MKSNLNIFLIERAEIRGYAEGYSQLAGMSSIKDDK